MVSPIDRLELLRATGKTERTRIPRLADLAEIVGVLRIDPEVPVDLQPLTLPASRQAFSRLDALGGGTWSPVHLEWSFGELREFDEDWSDSSLTQFKMRFRHRLVQAGIAPRHAFLICGAFSEMISNAQEHAGSPHRSLATFEVTNRLWMFSVTDFGIGIPDRLRQNRSYVALNDMNAICKALENGVSTHREVGRGMGFFQVFRVLTDRNAKVRIRAGRGLVDWTGDTNTLHPQPKPTRPGTHIRAGAMIPRPA